MKKQNVSDAVIRRLPRYYRYLDDLHMKGIVRISSSTLGEKMGIPLYIAAVVAFGTRMFQNFAEIRRELLTSKPKRDKIKQDIEAQGEADTK